MACVYMLLCLCLHATLSIYPLNMHVVSTLSIEKTKIQSSNTIWGSDHCCWYFSPLRETVAASKAGTGEPGTSHVTESEERLLKMAVPLGIQLPPHSFGQFKYQNTAVHGGFVLGPWEIKSVDAQLPYINQCSMSCHVHTPSLYKTV